jgi:hypothetical protein
MKRREFVSLLGGARRGSSIVLNAKAVGVTREVTMRRALTLAVTLALAATLARPVSAQDLASSIVGVWKLKSQVRKEVMTGKTTNTFGERPTGHIIYTRGGHFSFVVLAGNRKAPAGPDPTDAERVDLFKTMVAASGTYTIQGNEVVLNVETSWNQSWTGTRRPSQAEIIGNTLTLTTGPVKAAADGVEILSITTWDRAE